MRTPQDAAELFEQACSAFKLAKAWGDAAATYLKLSECHMKMNSTYEAATTIVDAGNCYKKISPLDALRCFERSVGLFQEAGRLQMAARQLKECAKMSEQAGDKRRALELHMHAADLFLGEEQVQEGHKELLEVAMLQGELEDFVMAIDTFERVALFYLDNHLLKFSARGILFNALICHLVLGDMEACRIAVDRYREMDVKFDMSREQELIDALITTIEAGDDQGFTDAVAQFDSLSRLDPWKTNLLLKIKRRIAAGTAAGFDEDDLT